MKPLYHCNEKHRKRCKKKQQNNQSPEVDTSVSSFMHLQTCQSGREQFSVQHTERRRMHGIMIFSAAIYEGGYIRSSNRFPVAEIHASPFNFNIFNIEREWTECLERFNLIFMFQFNAMTFEYGEKLASNFLHKPHILWRKYPLLLYLTFQYEPSKRSGRETCHPGH